MDITAGRAITRAITAMHAGAEGTPITGQGYYVPPCPDDLVGAGPCPCCGLIAPLSVHTPAARPCGCCARGEIPHGPPPVLADGWLCPHVVAGA